MIGDFDGDGIDDISVRSASSRVADLMITSLTINTLTNSPATVAPGGSFSVTDTTSNIGTGTPVDLTETRYRLSLDSFITPGDVLLAGTHEVGGVQPTWGSKLTVVVTVPVTMAAGTYFLGACADDLNAVVESNEMNNCMPSTTRIQVVRPDLIVSALSNPPFTVAVGGRFSVTDTTTNIGTAPPDRLTETRYRLSLDSFITPGDVLLAGTHEVGGVQPTWGSKLTVVVTVPVTMAAGTYFLGACADDLNARGLCRASRRRGWHGAVPNVQSSDSTPILAEISQLGP